MVHFFGYLGSNPFNPPTTRRLTFCSPRSSFRRAASTSHQRSTADDLRRPVVPARVVPHRGAARLSPCCGWRTWFCDHCRPPAGDLSARFSLRRPARMARDDAPDYAATHHSDEHDEPHDRLRTLPWHLPTLRRSGQSPAALGKQARSLEQSSSERLSRHRGSFGRAMRFLPRSSARSVFCRPLGNSCRARRPFGAAQPGDLRRCVAALLPWLWLFRESCGTAIYPLQRGFLTPGFEFLKGNPSSQPPSLLNHVFFERPLSNLPVFILAALLPSAGNDRIVRAASWAPSWLLRHRLRWRRVRSV